jgi:hypothetical protein
LLPYPSTKSESDRAFAKAVVDSFHNKRIDDYINPIPRVAIWYAYLDTGMEFPVYRKWCRGLRPPPHRHIQTSELVSTVV